MRILKTTLLVLLVVFVVIQFFRPAKNISNTTSPNDIAILYGANEHVSSILNKACNDCHSNNTKYPWYANIQPVAWWLNNHIQDGKKELNFSEFGTYRIRKQHHKLEEVIELVKKGEMPLSSYTIIHTDAKLTSDERAAVTGWADSIRHLIAAKYPPDSLILKR